MITAHKLEAYYLVVEEVKKLNLPIVTMDYRSLNQKVGREYKI